MRLFGVETKLSSAGCLLAAILSTGHLSGGETPPEVKISELPKLANGVPAYPSPFLAVARTPAPVAPIPHPLHIQVDLGYQAGYSGFVDAATGQVGFPGYKNFSILGFAFDDEKLTILVNYPYPMGRRTRMQVTDPAGDISTDDTFELLIEPRDAKGNPKGSVYRIAGNAAGVCKSDLDDPAIGQFHRGWSPALKYGVQMWDPAWSWRGGIQIPFKDVGGAPADGDIWGVQCALRYAAPKITALLSPANNPDRLSEDTKRFARLRFDRNRRANYSCHWLHEDEIHGGCFCVDALLDNGGNEPVPMALDVHIYKGDKEIAKGSLDFIAKPLTAYQGNDKGPLRIRNEIASPEKRDTVGRIVIFDKTFDRVIYDQFVPFWRPKPGERDWVKQYFAKEFVFQIGPYPSAGVFDCRIDCKTLLEMNPDAAAAEIRVSRDGREIQKQPLPLPKEGLAETSITVGRSSGSPGDPEGRPTKAGAMPDGAKYEITAAVLGKDGKEISSKTEKFTRKVMDFEKAPQTGLSDIVVPPFTPPVIEKASVSCWGRTYRHGVEGLLASLVAADKELLAGPARLVAKIGEGQPVALAGQPPVLKPLGQGKTTYAQTFSGGGLKIEMSGEFDYDGFYLFKAAFAPEKDPVDLKELRLEIPLKGEHATLLEAPVQWQWKGWEKCCGFLDKKAGRLWDSKTFPYEVQVRKSNMPPYVWFGDDDRGLCFSCASDQGTCNDDKLPAAALEREGQAVVLRIWAVNRPLKLEQPRSFEFALQASPYKPMLGNFRLWRCASRKDIKLGTYRKNGKFFHTGWGIGSYYPTYGRFLDLARNKEILDKAKQDYDIISASGSSCSECGGTPEYLEFWREWGSALGWDKQTLSPVPDWVPKLFKEAGDTPWSPYVMVESASNSSATNVAFRVWWLNEAVKKCGVGAMYQDNPPYGYYYQPASGYGYVRDDGAKEPACATWNARAYMRRVAHLMVENSVKDSPYTHPNVCGFAQPGRSFCRKGLTGEDTESDKISLGAMRVWFSKQWGINVDWLMQEPQAGATCKYWRALCSRLFLLDVTDFSRWDTADVAVRWLHALDVFWLDDPAIVWHPYYRNPTLGATARPTTLVSTYTANGRALFVISNQGADDTQETVAFQNLARFGAKDLKYFYDGETTEEIEAANETVKLFIPANDYRVVLGFTAPWQFAAKNALGRPGLPARSTADCRATITALALQLQQGLDLKPVENGHPVAEAWVQGVIGELKEEQAKDPSAVAYCPAKACSDIDLGDNEVRVAVAHWKKKGVRLVFYYNSGNSDKVLKGVIRVAIDKKLGEKAFGYVLDPVAGAANWAVIDLPAKQGKIEVLYPDNVDFWGKRHGPFKLGTLMSNMLQAVLAIKQEKEPNLP
ncbi:MAG: glycoside hydrolase domain-containing protein [Planctomycetota bacterium]